MYNNEKIIPFMNMFEYDIINANSVVGKIDLKLVFDVRSTPNNIAFFKWSWKYKLESFRY